MREEEMLDKNFLKTETSMQCTRVDELVAYLYGEVIEQEAQDFRSHLGDCSTCRAELSTFGEVREGIGAWRNAALDPMAVTDSATARNIAISIPTRSALGALKEFFALSPLWLRGATAFATLLFVALLFVTALNFFNHPEAQVTQHPPSVPMKTESQDDGSLANSLAIVAPDVVTQPVDLAASRSSKRKTGVDKVGASSRSVRREKANGLSNEELSDMLIAAKEDEETVPRLYDLLYESY